MQISRLIVAGPAHDPGSNPPERPPGCPKRRGLLVRRRPAGGAGLTGPENPALKHAAVGRLRCRDARHEVMRRNVLYGIAAGALLAAYAIASLYPFHPLRWGFPRVVTNGAQPLPGGGIRFPGRESRARRRIPTGGRRGRVRPAGAVAALAVLRRRPGRARPDPHFVGGRRFAATSPLRQDGERPDRPAAHARDRPQRHLSRRRPGRPRGRRLPDAGPGSTSGSTSSPAGSGSRSTARSGPI